LSNRIKMAKGGNDGWIAAKPKTKGPKVEESAKANSKLPRPIAQVKAEYSPKKDEKKKKTSAKKPRSDKQPFTIKDVDVARMSGSGTGVSACMNCLNFLTTEFTAPERIPMYESEKPDFPSSRLLPKAAERVNAVLDTLQTRAEQYSFLKVLINNMISTSRQAENAWGARVMGQLFIRKYPAMATVTSDIIQNETHPGAVMSVLWMIGQVKEFEPLMASLFWLVLPKLKQKKVAEYLPQILGDINEVMKREQKLDFSQNHVERLIRCMDDSKLQKPIMNLLTSFFTSIRDRLDPTFKWIENFLPLLSACNRQYALPIILKAIESAPEKATQELIRLSSAYRLQVDQVVEACPLDTLNEKLRALITAELATPSMASSEIKRKKKTAKKSASPVKSAKELQVVKECSSGCFLSSLAKYFFYAALLVAASSRIEATRPTYLVYAAPYVEQYVEPVYDTYVKPNYDEFVAPHVNAHVVPNYNKFIKPNIEKGVTIWNQKVQPVLSEKLSLVTAKYVEIVHPHVQKAITAATPVLSQLNKDTLALVEVARVKTAGVTKAWEGKVEELIKEGRAYVAIAGNEARRVIDLAAAKGASVVDQVKNYDYQSVLGQVTDKAGDLVSQVTAKTAELTVGLGDKVGVYYDQAMEATVEHRAIATEKVGQVVTVLVDKGSLVYAVVYEKAQDYEVAAYLEATFEGVGRSIIWIGDAVAELAGGRFCCFKSRMRKLNQATQDLGNDVYAKFKTV